MSTAYQLRGGGAMVNMGQFWAGTPVRLGARRLCSTETILRCSTWNAVQQLRSELTILQRFLVLCLTSGRPNKR